MTTQRLRLRPVTAADIPAMLTYRGNPEVCRYLPFEPMTAQSLAARLATDLGRREITAEGEALTLGVELAASGRLVGDVVVFYRSQEHATAEIGYVFHPEAAGHGYATEACAALLDLAFDGLQLHRVVARMDARNEPSARLAVRLGMRQEARHVRSEMFKGAWADLVVYAVLESEWRGRREHQAGGGGWSGVERQGIGDLDA